MPVATKTTAHFNTPVISAPTGPFALGTLAGVPTGTSLISSSGLGTNDGTESLTITHPVTGAQSTRTATVYRHRKWTATINPAGTSTNPILFDECEFNVTGGFFCVDINEASAVNDQMAPIVVFRRCTFTGNDTTGKCIVGSYAWVLGCHLGNTEDCWGGASYSLAQDSNFICTTDGEPDPHSDGIQLSGYGGLSIYHCWNDAGRDPSAANAPIRIGTEGAAVDGIDIRYTGLAGVAAGMQMRGDAGTGDITNVTVIGCRWVNEQIYGPTDFVQVTGVTWVNNAFMDGTTIPNPVP